MAFDRTESTALSFAAETYGVTARSSWRFRLVAAALLGLAAILRIGQAASAPAPAEAPQVKDAKPASAPVTLAEVTVSGAGTTRLQNLPDLVRRDVEAELAAIDWKKLALRRRYVLAAAVVRLDSAPTGARALAASCTISATVRDERGAILALVEGRAQAEDAPSAAAAAERDALAGAIKGAITAVPEAISRSQ